MTEIDSTCKNSLPIYLQIIKWILILGNFIASFAGFILIAIGLFLCLKYVDYLRLDDEVTIGVTIIAIVSFTICFTFLTLFGFFGSLKENRCLLLFFAITILFIFFMQFIIAFFTFAFKDIIYGFIQNDLIMSTNSSRVETREMWNFMQKNLECCGFSSPSDWKLSAQSLPVSCCKNNLKCPNELNPAFNTGCYDSLVNQINNNLTPFGITLLVVTIIQIIGILFSCLLSNGIKKKASNKRIYERKSRNNYEEF